MSIVPVYMACIERHLFGEVLWGFWRGVGIYLAVGGAATASVLLILQALTPPGLLWLAISLACSGLVLSGILWSAGFLDGDEKRWLRQIIARAAGNYAG
jgi:hypothetical protein